MKKIGQKLSFLTKVLLVVGLLISNLSSLSVVFAYEAPADLVIDLNDSILEINYTKELAEEVEAVDVRVYENYTYLDGKSEEEVVNVYSLTAEEIMSAVEGNLELKYDSIFALVEEQVSNYKLFDGTYSARVEMVDVTVYEVEENDVEPLLEEESAILQTTEIENETNEVVLASSTYEEKITHKSGLNVKLYDLTSNVEINLVNGKYPVSAEASKVEVVAQILAGGLNPTDIFEYAGEEYMASELLEKGFSSEIDFSGRLFGEYEIPVEVKVSKLLPVTEVVSETVEPEAMVEVVTTETDGNYEEVVYADSVSVMYESYEMNAELLNAAVVSEGYGESYLFYGKDAIQLQKQLQNPKTRATIRSRQLSSESRLKMQAKRQSTR